MSAFFLKFSEIFDAVGNLPDQILEKNINPGVMTIFFLESVNFGQFRYNFGALVVVKWDGTSYGLPKCCQNDPFFIEYYGIRKGWYFENISEFPQIPIPPIGRLVNSAIAFKIKYLFQNNYLINNQNKI